MLTGMTSLGYLTANALRNGNETVQSLYCNGYNCSAAQGQWLPLWDLNVSETYVVIADFPEQDILSLQEFDFFLVQGLSGTGAAPFMFSTAIVAAPMAAPANSWLSMLSASLEMFKTSLQHESVLAVAIHHLISRCTVSLAARMH